MSTTTTDEQFGFQPICDEINARFGIDLGLQMTGGGCYALFAELNSGHALYVTDAGDGTLTPIGERDAEGISGFMVGTYAECSPDGCYCKQAVHLDDPSATVDQLPDLIGQLLDRLTQHLTYRNGGAR